MSVRRFDRGVYGKATKTPEGFLVAPAKITRTGVFTYRDASGGIRRELRLPEEVFKPEALASFQLSPITDEHPPEWLDAKNTRKFARGTLGETVAPDGDYVSAVTKIVDAELVAKVESGEARELSCGYVCDLEESAGEWNGQPYDVIQRNIRGNHVAVVPMGRAGPGASIRLDASDAVMVSPEGARTAPQPQENPVSNRKKRIDGVDFEMPEPAAQAVDNLERKNADALAAKDQELAALQKKLDAAEKAKSEAEAKRDAALEDVKKKDAELKTATDPKVMGEKIAARAKLIALANKVVKKGTKLDGLSDHEIKLAALEAEYPKRDLSARKKDEAYVAAAFDVLAEELAEREDSDDDQDESDAARARKVADGADEDDDDEEREDGDDDDEDDEDRRDRRDDSGLSREQKARKKMLQQNRDAWKGEEKKA